MSAESSSSSSSSVAISLLTPNESRRIVRDEQRRRRIARLVQVRAQTKQESARIRQRVQEKKQLELIKAKQQLTEKLREEKEKALITLKQRLDSNSMDMEEEPTGSPEYKVKLRKSTRQQNVDAIRRHVEALRTVKLTKDRQKTQLDQQLLQRRRAVAVANARSRPKPSIASRRLSSQPIASEPRETPLRTHQHIARPAHPSRSRDVIIVDS